MTAPISLTHSPFLYHHVPNSPYLLPTRPQVTQSPVQFVPDIDNLTKKDNRNSTRGLLYNGKNNKSLMMVFLQSVYLLMFYCFWFLGYKFLVHTRYLSCFPMQEEGHNIQLTKIFCHPCLWFHLFQPHQHQNKELPALFRGLHRKVQ